MPYQFLFHKFFQIILCKIDKELADNAQELGCQKCGDVLHQANYPRSPIGILSQLREYYDQRFSLCCKTCRKRVTPMSVRFFGRRWYPAPALILVSILKLGISERRLDQVKKHLGIKVSESTWKRWRRWWRDSFEFTLFWKQAKGQLAIQPEITALISRDLLYSFDGRSLEEKVISLLKFLSPLTGGILRGV
jgi:hypothetical protein